MGPCEADVPSQLDGVDAAGRRDACQVYIRAADGLVPHIPALLCVAK